MRYVLDLRRNRTYVSSVVSTEIGVRTRVRYMSMYAARRRRVARVGRGAIYPVSFGIPLDNRSLIVYRSQYFPTSPRATVESGPVRTALRSCTSLLALRALDADETACYLVSAIVGCFLVSREAVL